MKFPQRREHHGTFSVSLGCFYALDISAGSDKQAQTSRLRRVSRQKAMSQRPSVNESGVPSSRRPQGIDYVQINKAREMFASTTRARARPAAAAAGAMPPATFKQPDRVPQVEAVEPPIDTMGIQSPFVVNVPASEHDKANCTNTQCIHCGRVIIPSPVASFPLVETPSISVGSWEIYTTKQPILTSDEIDLENERLGIPVPEMIFGHNKVEIKNKELGFSISFNTPDALSLVDTTGTDLIQVSYSKEWFSTRKTNGEDVKGIVKPFDWTYSTTYRGSLPDGVTMEETENEHIPLDKLKRPDPILFFDDMVLYEDELGDNGISVLSCKIRVMPERLLLLQRFFMRVDNVLFRVRDTRVYVDFHENKVIREYKEQQGTHQQVMKKISPLSGDPRSFLRDQNWIAQRLPVEKVIVDVFANH